MRIKCVLKPLCVNAAILINDVGINICHHLHLCMARITLDCFHMVGLPLLLTDPVHSSHVDHGEAVFSCYDGCYIVIFLS